MPKYVTTEVFTPASPAKLTFVEREAVNDQLVSALKTPGKQIVVYGHTGSGKTTVLARKLEQLYERHITSRCTSTTTFTELLINAFEQLEHFYSAEQSTSNTRKDSANVEIQLSRIRSQLGRAGEKSESTKATRLVPPQLTAQTLAGLLGAAHACWLLEDFHKVPESEKVKLAQCLKVFMDMADTYPEVKIVAIGAVDTAREVVQYEPEMRNRVSEIAVPLMTFEELSQIIELGTELLNVVGFEHDFVENVVWFSNSLASVCHSLCLYTCEAAGIQETSEEGYVISNDHLKKGLERWVADGSDTIKSVFDKAFKQSKKTKFDNYRIVVKALASFGQEGASSAALYSRIRQWEPDYPHTNLKHCLNKLAAAERGAIVRYSTSSHEYSFADPVFRAFALGKLKENRSTFGLFVDTWLSGSITVTLDTSKEGLAAWGLNGDPLLGSVNTLTPKESDS
jgi:energy-coupling factor transporter ATP-binding protein EcfA2